KYGMVKAFSVRDNMRIQTYYAKPFSKGIVADDEAIDEKSQAWIDAYDVRTPNIYVNIGSLSGGNQQKAVVAREFSRPSKLLIAAQPTRGIDVGSIEFIHNQLVKMRDAGVAVLLVSTELDEIMGLSDRIAVMYAGKVIDIIPGEGADREKIGLLMAGIKEEAQHG
ncbi:MAG TPA: heme ABC transporter ATP-binding protein, partial [Aggregatilineales bacterium]|nr:heme ABC transporter ATP-binding protein [Aggregatilineales bacterium]